MSFNRPLNFAKSLTKNFTKNMAKNPTQSEATHASPHAPNYFTWSRLNALLTLGLMVAIGGYLGSVATSLWGTPLAQMITSTDKNYWYLSRASGVMAYALFWLAMVFGLLLGTRLTRQLSAVLSPKLIFDLHQFLSLVAVTFAGFHALILIKDAYLNIGLWQILMPFTFASNTLGTAMGQVGLWLLLICVGSFYIKPLIGQAVWRWLHFLTFSAYALVSVHVLMTGSDTQVTPLLLFYAGSQMLVFVLIGYRMFGLLSR